MAARRKRTKKAGARKRVAKERPARAPAQRARRAAKAAPAAAARPEAPSARPAGGTPRIAATRPEAVARVLRYFARPGAALLALEGPLALGDWIHVRGATSDFVQSVSSLRAGRERVERASGGEVGVQLAERARPGDRVFVLRPAP